MKKHFKVKILAALSLSASIMLSACTSQPSSSSSQAVSSEEISNSQSSESDSSNGEKLQIVVSTFPIYDWMSNIIGDNSNIELSFITNDGVDLHSFQPTTEDIANIMNADMFVHIGGESDAWVEEVVSQSQNSDMQVVNLMEEIPDRLKEEEVVSGMQEHDHEDETHSEDEHEDETHSEDEHDHEDETHDDGGHTHEGVYDEHIWLSLSNAIELVDILDGYLSELDPENEAKYEENSENYIAKLDALDDRYENELSGVSKDTILVADRFPFRYLVDDYDINYYAAFPGCSAETEASFETVAFLSEKVDELDFSSIIIIDDASEDLARTIIDNSQKKASDILVLDSMQTVTGDESEGGTTYLSIMENNLSVLVTALS